jgi:hypothetical protein
MGYDESVGSSEGAVLIFAHTAKEAKKVFWKACGGEIVEEYIDARVVWLKDRPWLFLEIDLNKSAAAEAHVVVSPLSCARCETWGTSRIGDNGLCESCKDPEHRYTDPPK